MAPVSLKIVGRAFRAVAIPTAVLAFGVLGATVPARKEHRVSSLMSPPSSYYVSPGSVGGRCSDAFSADEAASQATPWCSVDRAAQSAPAGATVYVRGGSYEHFLIANRCRSDWVTFKPYPGESVVLDGGNGGLDDFAGGWELDNDCYIHVQGFELTDRFFLDGNDNHIDIDGNYIHSKDPNPSASSGSANVTVSGVVTRCSGSSCVSGQSDIMIENNRIDHVAYNCLGTGSDLNACDTNDNSVGTGYGYCIQINPVTPNLVIRNNQIDGCWEDAIQGVPSGALISGNDISDITGGASGHQDGIQIFNPAGSSNTTITANNFHGALATCMRIQNGPRTNFTITNNICAGDVGGRCMDLEELRDSLIAYNTCGVTQFGTVLEDDPNVPGAPQNDVIEDNIFEDAVDSVSLDMTGTGLVYRYNIVTDPSGVGEAAIANCTPGCSTSHPTFVNPSDGSDMRLAAGSVGIDAGIDASVSTDAGGRLRPVDVPSIPDSGTGAATYVDIGAYERQLTDP